MVKKSVTLPELMIAISLLGMIVAMPVAFELFTRVQLKTTERRVGLINEAMYGVEYIAKVAKEGIGSFVNPGVQPVTVGGTTIGVWIRQDANGNYQPDDNVGTIFVIQNNSLLMRTKVPYPPPPLSGLTTLINGKINDTNSQLIPISSNGVNNGIRIKFTLKENPTQPSSLQNPQVILQTDIIINSNSIS